jgi:Chromo (CHRromatin Organisation MOdifier) domain
MESTGIRDADMFMRKMATEINRARKCLVAAQDRQAAYANRKRRDMEFHTGDYVLVGRNIFPAITRLPNSKWKDRFIGPFKVIGAFGNVYRLELPEGYDINPHVNIDRLRLYSHRDSGGPMPPPPPPQIVNGQLEYDIGEIVHHRHARNARGQPLFDPDGSPHMEYLVRWKGYTSADDTWEKISQFTRDTSMVEKYRASHGLPPLPPKGTVPRPRS